MKKYSLKIMLAGLLLVGAFLVYEQFHVDPDYSADLAYSDFIKKVKTGQIEKVEIKGNHIQFLTSAGEELDTCNPGDLNLINDLLDAGIKIRTPIPEQRSLLMEIFISWFPTLILIVILLYYLNKMQNAGSRYFCESLFVGFLP